MQTSRRTEYAGSAWLEALSSVIRVMERFECDKEDDEFDAKDPKQTNRYMSDELEVDVDTTFVATKSERTIVW